MPATAIETIVRIPVEGQTLESGLAIPDHPAGLVVFAHGRSDTRADRQSTLLAAELQAARLATLDFDLLTPAERQEPDYKYQVEAPAKRLGAVVRWAREHPALHRLPTALLAWGTGASAALVVASQPGSAIRALVSCGGRPEFAGDAAERVTASALFIVGGFDWAIIDLNESAVGSMKGTARLDVVPRATHEFEEEGALEAAARLARNWLTECMAEARAHH